MKNVGVVGKKFFLCIADFQKLNTKPVVEQNSYFLDRWKDIVFCRIGCWQSAFLCDRTNCPNIPLPMVPASLCSYIMYMFGNLDVRVCQEIRICWERCRYHAMRHTVIQALKSH